MDAITALHSRVSVNMLAEPAPDKQALDTIIKAGLRACDHGGLTPWKFLLIEGARREEFGKLMAETKGVMDGGISEELSEKLAGKPYRAPMILAVVATIKEHPKVPEIEQMLSAGAAAQMMMVAAHALGFGAIWRSGNLMFHEHMQDGLGLARHEKLVGFIYLGTPQITKPVPELAVEDFVVQW